MKRELADLRDHPANSYRITQRLVHRKEHGTWLITLHFSTPVR